MASRLFHTYLDLLAAELTRIEPHLYSHIHLDEYLRKARATVKPTVKVIDLMQKIERNSRSLIAAITTNPQGDIVGHRVELLSMIDELRIALQDARHRTFLSSSE